MKNITKTLITVLIGLIMGQNNPLLSQESQSNLDKKMDLLIGQMTLEEKIGQMSQFNGFGGTIPEDFKEKIRSGAVGSVLNEVNTETLNEIQRIAVEESRLGIPILVGRDVIHGFKTILPIPLGQAASWNPDLVEKGAEMAAIEASSVGIHWTFAPMVDVTRDPRWGRIAESLGEDPYLTSVLGSAMVRGFQGSDLSEKGRIAACAKHFAGYGAAEGGRDYNTAGIPENELRDVYLIPFEACINSGVSTIMSAFNEVNGIPATGNEFLLNQILRSEWKFKGFVVSDWESVIQQVTHGYTPDSKAAAAQAIRAGVDMEMASTSYAEYIPVLLEEGLISLQQIDESVRKILSLKFRLGLFDNPFTDASEYPELVNPEHLALARKLARQSLVLLKNADGLLPLSVDLKKVAVIGPLADAPHDQLGTWVFDGEKKHSVTPLSALTSYLEDKSEVLFAPGLKISRTKATGGFAEAVEAAGQADVILLFLGEESILSGESHCRADISLPGAQEDLVKVLSETGKPMVGIILAGRPLTIRPILDLLDAVIYAWHPGTMAGPAIADILYGIESPSGKIPVTFPTTAGQIPMYYAHKNTGKPPTEESWVKMEDIPVEPFQLSIGNTSHYLDEGYKPLFPFGFGLSYTTFEYSDLKVSDQSMPVNEKITVSATVTNSGTFDADEIVQLYVRDLFASRTRPVRELKRFQRIHLKTGESRLVSFTLEADDLTFHNPEMKKVVEPGRFHVWIGGSSETGLMTEFEIVNGSEERQD